jgi:hypothetical protein
MRSNCPECGRSLTIKEALEDRCYDCSRPLARTVVAPRPFKSHCVDRSFVKKNFDLMISDELRKRNFPPAA